MAGTATIDSGTKSATMIQIGAGRFIFGSRQKILITKVGRDEETPLFIREALVGMEVETIFTKESLERELDIRKSILPDRSRIALAKEIIKAFKLLGKNEAANALRKLAGNKLDIYVFEPDTFRLITDQNHP